MKNLILWLIRLSQGIDFPNPPTPTPPPTTNTVLDEINRIRVEHRLPPLHQDECLSEQAENHAKQMLDRGVLSHDGFGDRLKACGENAGSENVAAGYRTPSEVVAGWMSSTGHRRNILGNWSRCGTGKAASYWCVIFA